MYNVRFSFKDYIYILKKILSMLKIREFFFWIEHFHHLINIVTPLLKEPCTKVPWIFLCLNQVSLTHWVASSTWIVHESAIENRKVNEDFPTFLYLHWPIRIIKYQGKSVFLFSHSQNWKSLMHFGNGIPSNIRKITISQNKKWPH